MSLFELLDSEEIRSTAQLAELLGTSAEMIEAQLQRYEQLGFVKKTVLNLKEECGGKCKSCKGCTHKKQVSQVVYWEKM